jgi:hypothetical protein
MLRRFFVRAMVLRSVGARFPWFQTLLRNVVVFRATNQPSDALKRMSKTKDVSILPSTPPLAFFSSVDAEAAGRSLSISLSDAVKTTPEITTRLWISQNPAMIELELELAPFFLPFMTHVVKCLREANGKLLLSSREWEQDVDLDRGSRELIKQRIRTAGEYTKEEETGLERGL